MLTHLKTGDIFKLIEKQEGGEKMLINSKPIKDYLNLRAITQEEFANMAGISRVTLYGTLYRETAAISTVKKIAAAMDIDVSELARETK